MSAIERGVETMLDERTNFVFAEFVVEGFRVVALIVEISSVVRMSRLAKATTVEIKQREII